MKRVGHLIQEIAKTENLYLAYYKAVKSKRAKEDVIDYADHLNENIKILQSQILSGKVVTGYYHYFKIFDPKERTICAASFPERVMHHALMNVCHPIFEKHLIYDSYATRPNKGTYAALDRAKVAVKKYEWVAKLDVRKYFDNISHEILKQKLRKLFKDKLLLNIFDDIIDSYHTSEKKGIPIGNLTSQYFANYYFSAADHFAKEVLQFPFYIRYMDDVLLFYNNKSVLLERLKNFCNYVEFKMNLQFKPHFVNRTNLGISFLGYRLYPYMVRLNISSKKRFIKKLNCYYKNLEHGTWSQSEYSRHVLPLIAFTEYAQSKALRKKCIFAAEGQQS